MGDHPALEGPLLAGELVVELFVVVVVVVVGHSRDALRYEWFRPLSDSRAGSVVSRSLPVLHQCFGRQV